MPKKPTGGMGWSGQPYQPYPSTGATESRMAAPVADAAFSEGTVVLFICTQNAGRSQVAKALFNALVDPQAAVAISAGSRPAEHVHPEVVQVMQETGIDLSSAQPVELTQEVSSTAQILVTMGCDEACVTTGQKVIKWQIPDPHQQSVDAVRELRDLLRSKVLELAEQQGYQLRAAAG